MFHYFFPGQKLDANKHLPDGVFKEFCVADSIGDLAESHKYTAFEVNFDNQPGVFLTPFVGGVPAPAMLIDMENQTWHRLEVMNDGFVYIGWTDKHPPSPSTLLREGAYAGYGVQGSNGHQWRIPVARSVNSKVTLPTAFKFDLKGSGDVEQTLDQRYDRIWELSGLVYDGLQEAGEKLKAYEQAKIALEALSLNYRIGPAEHNAMTRSGIGVINSIVAEVICNALIDFQLIDQVADEKKTDSPAEPLSNGDSGSQD